ncbi:50S ribosomal protein L16 [Candidatus Woesearchaeota archaeon]|nr:MAG: 50S ribosomal protein L16 [Candidatus Woesearchaeota archaeon ex4484_78]RLE46135.1 MAG: 50S ribosomal protein L16 [Candidatus Woesearchaeota archaeon]
MARLRSFICYRGLKRPYTRFSKYKRKSFVKSRPHNRISRYTGGEYQDYDHKVHLISKEAMQIRDQALESARQTMVRNIEKNMGKAGFFYQMRVYPHHILRENPLAAGAGADRLSTGMAHSFGKPIGRAAQVYNGQELLTVMTNKDKIALVKTALLKASHKLPCKCKVVIQ